MSDVHPAAPSAERSVGRRTAGQIGFAGLRARSWALVALFGTLFSLAIAPAVDPDLGWHLGAGRWIWENRTIPLTDPFSWSVPGRKWIAHEWLTEVVMHGIRSFGGDGLLIAIWAIVITAAWALLYRTARIAGARLVPAALLVGIGAITTVHTWGVRPQMLTLLLVVFTGMRLQTWRLYSDARTPWELIPVTVAWANLHGGYIFGIVMVLVFACGTTGERVVERLRPVRLEVTTGRRLISIWTLFLGTVIASLATPNTVDGLIYPFTYLGDNASTRYVGEWFAPSFAEPQFWPFALILVGLAATVIVGLRRRTLGLTELGLTVPFAAMGVQSVRNISQTVVCAVPVIAAVWSEARTPRSKTRSPRNMSKTVRTTSEQATPRQLSMIAGVAASMVVLSLVALTRTDLTSAGNAAARSREYPLIATEWLAENPGKVFNHYNFGGWLVLQRVPVYVDGRPDMYGDAFMDDYVRMTGPAVADWQAEMDRIGADRILFPSNSSITKQIVGDVTAGKAIGWTEVELADPAARLFVRR
jgi:hypothetical protein